MNNYLKLQEENARLITMAERDGLTGLYNRNTFEHKVDEILEVGGCGVLLVIDADHFKEINDRYGHLTGDQMLQRISLILERTFRKEDLVGRVGGDEFVVFLPNGHKIQAIESRMIQAQQHLRQTKLENGLFCPLSITYGISIYREGDTYRSLFDKADQEMLQNKQKRNNKDRRKPSAVVNQRSIIISRDVGLIQEDLREQEAIVGAFCQDYETFKTIYRFMERGLKRAQAGTHIILFTLTDTDGNLIPLSDREGQMKNLGHIIQKSLRIGDVYTQYSSCQYLVMAVGASDENSEKIGKRLMDEFYTQLSKPEIECTCLEHVVYPLHPVSGKAEVG